MPSRAGALVMLVALVGMTSITMSAPTPPARAAAPPDIVFILTDDEAALDGRLMDAMPNGREMWRQHGVTFTDFRSQSPLCCPSRANYLSGQFTQNHGVISNRADLFQPEMSIATALDGIGYTTAFLGKYFNQYSNIAPELPPGWDRFIAFGDANYYNYDLWVDGGATPEKYGKTVADYSTDVLSSKAVQIVESTPTDQPLMLYIAPAAPHGPITPAERHKNAACSTPPWSPPNYQEADVSDKPMYIQRTRPGSGTGRTFQTACRTLLAVDDLVGDLRDSLAAAGRLENTIFIYGGDNGMAAGAHRLEGKGMPHVTEVPFYVSWPAVLGTDPRVIDEPLLNVDLAPTLCELAGCTLGPYPNGQAGPDGVSFAKLLLGTASDVGRDALLEQMLIDWNGIPAWDSVTTTDQSTLGRWQYVEYRTGERELYDISNGPCWTWAVGQPGDPCRLENAIDDPTHATTVAALQARLGDLKAQGPGPGGNRAPSCANRTLTTQQDTAATVSPSCTDADGDALTISVTSQPAHGTASVQSGQLRYVPAAGYHGPDSFGYRATDPDAAASNVATVSVTVSPADPGGAPTASFSASPLSGTAPLQVAFSDTSSGAPTSWSWDFDGDGTSDSSEQHPSHTYPEPGSYSVSLTVGNAEGTDSVTRAGYITVSPAGGAPVVVIAQEDAYVISDSPTANHGQAKDLRVRQSGAKQLHAYLKFVVTGSGAPGSATLRLYVRDAGTQGGDLFLVTDSSWSESSLTWVNRPTASGAALDSVGTAAAGTWVEWDVSSVVTGDGTYSFVLLNASNDVVRYDSSEAAAATRPQLVIDGS